MTLKSGYNPPKPTTQQAMDNLPKPDAALAEMLSSLSIAEREAAFFHLLKDPALVSELSNALAKVGYAQNNLLIAGAKGSVGDQIVLCRWLKAASGAMMMATRFDEAGELEILFGEKRDANMVFWALPGGHYELDNHANLDHTLVAEMMEETALIPYSRELLPYITATLEEARDLLPYKTIEEAPDSFISRDFSWELVTVVSGKRAHHIKRSINIGYRVHFHDGAKLTPKATDDLGSLQWFKLSQLYMEGEEKLNPERVNLNQMLYGNDVLILTALERTRAWQLYARLQTNSGLEELDFFTLYVKQLMQFGERLEQIYGTPQKMLLVQLQVGPRHANLLERLEIIHELRPLLRQAVLSPLDGYILHILVENRLFPLLNAEEKAAFSGHSAPIPAGFTPLHRAVLQEDAASLGKLLENSVNLDAALPDGRTPLHLLCEYGKSENILKILLNKGANPQAVDAEGNNILHLAVRSGNLRIVKFIFKLLG